METVNFLRNLFSVFIPTATFPVPQPRSHLTWYLRVFDKNTFEMEFYSHTPAEVVLWHGRHHEGGDSSPPDPPCVECGIPEGKLASYWSI